MARPATDSALRRLTGVPATLGVRILGRGLAFISAIVLARVLGIEEYGVYAYAIAWTAILIVPSILGFDLLLVRYVAIYKERGSSDLIRGLVRYAHKVVVPASLVLIGLAALGAGLFLDRTYLAAVLVALPIVPIRALTAIRVGILQGLRRPELSFLPVFIVLPLGTAALVLTLHTLGVDIGAELAVGLAGIATGAGLLTGALLARHFLRPLLRDVGFRTDITAWRRALGPFTASAIIVALSSQIGLLFLGALSTPEDVGVFHAATRLAEPVGLIFVAVTIATAPRLARLHDLGDSEGLGETAQRASRASLYYSLPFGLAVVAAQGPLFGLFGPGFTGGGLTLTLLVGAQLFNALAGSVGNVLLMTGHGKPVAWVKGAALAVNVALCVTLIPPLGVTGAAIARAVDMVLWNAVLAVVAWRRLGVNATALPWPRGAMQASRLE